MPWIKKNLTLVLGGLVGLILLGASGFFLYSESQREAAVNMALEDQRAEWTRLNSLNPFPDDRNIKSTKEEIERMRKLADALRESLRPVEVPPVSDTFSLRLLIETTISELTHEAEQAGVRIPDRYAFTFQRLRELGGQFHSNAIPELAEQVSHISTICKVLFNAKVHSLDTLRRAPVLKDEGGGADYLSKRSITNNGVVRTPYDVSFRTFSGELASVIRGLASLDECVVIKTLNIEPTTLPSSQSPAQPVYHPSALPQAPTGPFTGGPTGPSTMSPELRARYGIGPGQRPGEDTGPGAMSPELRARYGIGPPGSGGSMRSRYGIGPSSGVPPTSLATPLANPYLVQQPTPGPHTPQPSRGPNVVIDERPLRVILQLDFVRPAAESVTQDSYRAVTPYDGATDESGVTEEIPVDDAPIP